MLSDGGETPSRYELLSMVKKHSTWLTKTAIIEDEDDSSNVEMDNQFWRDILDLYFVRSTDSRGRQDDDLVFFVKRKSTQGYGLNDNVQGGDSSPYFVRRWASKLHNLVGESSVEVDWRRSFYLNLIAHTSYAVTVAICSHQVLRNHQAGKDHSLSPIYKVVKTVYASPSRVNFQLDSKKEVETTPAYPEICFAIDDFDSTCDAVVLTSTDHCYCVLLNATGGVAFPRENAANDGSSSGNSGANCGNIVNPKLTLFSGFVSYHMVREAYDAGKSRFGILLGHSSGKTDRLYMKGPGGRGEVEVAVSGVVDQSQQVSCPCSPVISKHGFVGSVFRKAASVASVAAKHAYAAAAAAMSTASDDEMVPLKCCLMSISLPWEYIAYDLLFKGSPPVNM